jgi:hypothetical protein
LAKQKELVEVTELSIQEDHVHTILSIPPKYLCGTQRQGSTMSDEELAKLIYDIHKYLPACVRKVIVRGDAEFIGGLTIAACRECGYLFLFGNKSCKPIFDERNWYQKNEYSHVSVQYVALDKTDRRSAPRGKRCADRYKDPKCNIGK